MKVELFACSEQEAEFMAIFAKYGVWGLILLLEAEHEHFAYRD